MFANTYFQKRVLVTGHTGFKGSWLVEWLLALGADVAGFALDPPSFPANFTVLEQEKRIRHYVGDIRDAPAIAAAVHEFCPQAVFHMAAQSLVRPAYEDPTATFAVNAMGTLNLLEAVRGSRETTALVCITSDKCYRNDEWVFGYRETDRLGGVDPYSASKACAEIIAHSYFRSFFPCGPRTATVRAGNVIGGGDWALDRIVPDCARSWSAGRPVTIRSPWATRPWQHVLEPLSGYLWLGACLMRQDLSCSQLPLDKEAFNFGPAADVNATVAQVTQALAAHWPGFSTEMDGSATRGKKESILLKLCCDKALAHLCWKPVLNFQETVSFTAAWYKAYYQEGCTAAANLTRKQIAAYTAKAAAKELAWTKK